MDGVPICRLSDWLTTSSVSVISLKTLYRWKRRFQNLLEEWWVAQRKKLASEFQEDDGILSLYRRGMSSTHEIQLLLSFFFGGKASVPCMGRLFSMFNLRHSFSL